jgi:hypothetical protein
MSEPPVSREELEVAIEARRELSPEHEPEIVAAFLDRIGGAIDARVDERLAERKRRKMRGSSNELAFYSLIFGIPLTAIAGGQAGLRRLDRDRVVNLASAISRR